MNKNLLSLIVVLLTLSIVPVSAAPSTQDAPVTELPWWNDRIFYEVFVRAFEDSDGDGNGDIPGLISKLDYLNDGDPDTDTDLGVTGIWLMPIMQSPTYHGYDVTDYEQIESDYGTNEDFRLLIAEAHKRGIAVIVDLMLNHTSNEHPWFIDSQTPGSPHDSWYRWQPSNPGYLGPWGEVVWHRSGSRYYYGVFWSGMPDLNLNNPAVTQAVYDVADFWLNDMGVDGFRLDAIKHLVEDNQKQENTPGTLRWLAKWNEHINEIAPEAFTVGEVFGGAGPVLSLYAPDNVDTVFEFGLSSAILNSVQLGRNANISNVQSQVLGFYPPGQYSAFLTNHDQNRLMNTLNSVDKNKVAASLLLTQPGVPFLYYGEEIGMIGLKPDECIRTPFQWDDTQRVAPFMTGKNCETNEAEFNLAAQVDDPQSLFNHYRTLIHLRNDHTALREGEIVIATSRSNHIYGFIRYSVEETLLVVVNLSGEVVSDYALTIESGPLSGTPAANLLMGEGDVAMPSVTDSGGFVEYTPLPELAPYSTTIIQLGG